MIIDYDKNPNITEEQRLRSFKESVQRALSEIDMIINGGSVSGTSVQGTGKKVPWTILKNLKGITFFGKAEKEAFVVGGEKQAEFTGDIVADKDIYITDSSLEALWEEVFGSTSGIE